MKTKTRIACAMGVVVATLSGAATNNIAMAATIDSFTGTQSGSPVSLTVSTVGPIGGASETGVAGVIGGDRTTSMTGVMFDAAGIDSASASIFPAAGFLDYESSVGATALVTLNYGPGLAADFSADDRVRIDLLDFDFANGIPMLVTVSLNDGVNSASFAQSVNASGPNPNFDFLFSAFPPVVNFAAIDSIEVNFAPGKAADFRVGSITTEIPEPASLALLLCGALAVNHRSTHRRTTNPIAEK